MSFSGESSAVGGLGSAAGEGFGVTSGFGVTAGFGVVEGGVGLKELSVIPYLLTLI